MPMDITVITKDELIITPIRHGKLYMVIEDKKDGDKEQTIVFYADSGVRRRKIVPGLSAATILENISNYSYLTDALGQLVKEWNQKDSKITVYFRELTGNETEEDLKKRYWTDEDENHAYDLLYCIKNTDNEKIIVQKKENIQQEETIETKYVYEPWTINGTQLYFKPSNPLAAQQYTVYTKIKIDNDNNDFVEKDDVQYQLEQNIIDNYYKNNNDYEDNGYYKCYIAVIDDDERQQESEQIKANDYYEVKIENVKNSLYELYVYEPNEDGNYEWSKQDNIDKWSQYLEALSISVDKIEDKKNREYVDITIYIGDDNPLGFSEDYCKSQNYEIGDLWKCGEYYYVYLGFDDKNMPLGWDALSQFYIINIEYNIDGEDFTFFAIPSYLGRDCVDKYPEENHYKWFKRLANNEKVYLEQQYDNSTVLKTNNTVFIKNFKQVISVDATSIGVDFSPGGFF